MLVTIAYWGVWELEFTNFDDLVYVVENPHVRGLTGANVGWALTSFERAIWSPLVWLSFMVDFELWGLDPAGYHLQNLLWHGAAVLLLYLVLSAMTEEPRKSALVAAVFAVHPVHVESVAWVAERKDVLSAAFFMLALAAYLAYCRRPGTVRYLGVAAAMVLGLASKPTLVTLPGVLLLLDYWPLGRLRSRAQVVPRLLEKLPLLALSIVSSLVTAAAARETVIPVEGLAPWARLSNAALSYARYLGMFAWPVDLAVYYPHPGPEGWPVLPTTLAALLIVAGTIAAIRMRARHPYLPVGWLWYLGVLVPMIGVVQFAGHALADRFLHLPSIGLSIVAVWGLAELAHLGVRRNVLAAAAVGWVLALTLSTRLQTSYWRDSLSLWQRAVAVTDGSFLTHYNLAQTLATAGRLEEAIQHSLAALRFNPDHAGAHSNLALCYARLGRNDEALAAYQAAVRLDPDHANALNGLGVLYAANGDLERAARQFERTLAVDPGHRDARQNLVLAYRRLGRPEDAQRELDQQQGNQAPASQYENGHTLK